VANYTGAARTNYFRVKDRDAFNDALQDLDVTISEQNSDPQFVCLLATGTDDGCFPSWVYNEDTDDHDDIDLPGLIADHLVDGDVAIIMEAGHEKLRYVSGWALAVNSKGETVQVTLNDIYDKAKTLGDTITDASY
jgi:hypothetical protein